MRTACEWGVQARLIAAFEISADNRRIAGHRHRVTQTMVVRDLSRRFIRLKVILSSN
jgi:predicted amidohydrolase YtcJ